jgi:predicted MFS family arabinose efflux permease
VTNDRRRNLTVLFLGQALIGCQSAVHIVLGGLAGAHLAGNPAFATLPISIVVLVSMFVAPGASLLMGRYGRRFGFILGASAGAVGAGLVLQSLRVGSFGMLVLGSAFFGVTQGTVGFYRFAAADAVDDSFKPKAISIVLAGGLVSALLGPEVVRVAGDAMDPIPYAGAYAVILAIDLIGISILAFLRIPPPRPEPDAAPGRPLREVFREPRVSTAVICAMVSYAVMSLVMTSTPLAMVSFGFTDDHAADVVRWHAFAMFAPSFVTGWIIDRVGQVKVIATGLLLLAACSAVALAGVELHQFYLALIALGIGWNFGFIGATSLLAASHTRAEQARVQGLNDFLVFGLVAVASFASGALLNWSGWNAVQVAAIPALAFAAIAIIWLAVTGAAASRDAS